MKLTDTVVLNKTNLQIMEMLLLLAGHRASTQAAEVAAEDQGQPL